RPDQKARDGVFYSLALTFGTLLSSQGTDASFGPVSGPSGRFPSVFHHSIRSFSAPLPLVFRSHNGHTGTQKRIQEKDQNPIGAALRLASS
ncbi:hypothetical protein ABZ769_37045, partial [Streptomyces olivoreticuli]